MGDKETVTPLELGLLVAGGLICTVGAVAWLWGIAQAILTLGLVLLVAAYCCAGKD